jgi:hypothetical protein
MMLLDSLDSNWKMGLEHFYLLEGGGGREGGSMTSRKSQKDERFPTLTT